MLKIKSGYHLDFPHITFDMPHQMQLSAVPADDDELVQDIANDPLTHDDMWQLEERPDGSELAAYLDSVTNDKDLEFAQE